MKVPAAPKAGAKAGPAGKPKPATAPSAVAKAAAKPVAKPAAAPKPRAARKAPAPAIDAGQGKDRLGMIAVAAYFRAERRGFEPGSEIQDWLEAEAEIERLLAGR